MILHSSDQKKSPKKVIKMPKPQYQIKISNVQMHELSINDSKFEKRIRELNKSGVQLIEKEKESEALVHLLQGEKILEYVASCGRTIDRVLITTTLKNEACAYQKLWDLEKASDYMEAIIYNIKASLDTVSLGDLDQEIRDEGSKSYLEFSTYMSRKKESIFYYLQYSAVNSQINRHNLALQSTKKALNMLHSVCSDALKYEKIKKGKNSLLMEELVDSCVFDQFQLKDLFLETKDSLQSISKHRQFFSFDTEIIQKFVIGDIMQISTCTVEQALKKMPLEQQISHLGVIMKALYLSICYFVMGTQMRLISKQKQPIDKKTAQEQLRMSKIYHLYSIKIGSTMVACESKYLQHIVKSFKNHYDLDLYKDDKMQEEEISTIQIEGKQSYEQFEVRVIQERIEKQNEKFNQITENTKVDTFVIDSNECEVPDAYDILCTPNPKNKKKIKRSQKKTSTIKVNSKYVFPKVKAEPKINVVVKGELHLSKNKQIRQWGLTDKTSRVRKVNQEYFMNDEERKKITKSRTKYKNNGIKSQSKDSSVQSKGGLKSPVKSFSKQSREKRQFLKIPQKGNKK